MTKYFVEINTADGCDDICIASDARVVGLPQTDILGETYPHSHIHFGHLLLLEGNKYYGGMGEGTEHDNWGDAMLASLYDLFQVNDNLKDGDTIVATYQGEAKTFVCQGFHVLILESC